MASFRQRNGKWQVRVIREGYPDQTKTFETKVDAEKWARSVESEIDKGQFANISEAQRTTLGDLIECYLVEVTPLMKGATEDTIRLKAIKRKPLARWSMANLSASRIATYRDERLKEVSAGTVQCRAPASRGKTKCRFHGGASTGPKTEQGRQRCTEVKTVHGCETRKARTERAEGMRRLRELEDLGYSLVIMSGPKTPGRKPRT